MLTGLLTVADPARHLAAFSRLREANAYARPLTYASTDRLKLPFALAVIDHIADSPDFAFRVETGQTARHPPAGPEGDLQQLAAFLTGCAYGDRIGTAHPLKRTLIDALKTRTSLLA